MIDRLDTGEDNDFLKLIVERPVHELPQLFKTREPDIVEAAQAGMIPAPAAVSAMRAHGAEEGPAADVSIGYSALAKNDYRLEVRLQHPSVATVLFAQEVVQRANGRARIAEYQGLKVHAAALGPSGSLPLSIGCSVGHPKSPPGTLGLFVKSPEGVGILSNSHVLARCGRARRGDLIYAPHPSDPGAGAVKIAKLSKFSNLVHDDGVASDAALALLNDGVGYAGNKIPDTLPDAGKHLIRSSKTPVPGLRKVSKIGRTSRHTSGTFSAADIDPTVEYPGLGDVKLTGMFEILWDSPQLAFSEPGDSGSVVYLPDTMEAIALVVGGGVRIADGVSEGVSIACPLEHVLAEWELSLLG
ncbi:MAG: hypothetical protein WC670_20180 [Pseudolabrys sp.]